MDVEYPFAAGVSRRQLLYRLPSTPLPRRLLLVSDTAESELIGGGWGGPVTTLPSSETDAALRQGGACFDAVALPGLLGARATSVQRQADDEHLLHVAFALLISGGVVVGHLENICALRRVTSRHGLAQVARAALRPGAIVSASRCKGALVRAGFIEPECYYVQPSIAEPMGLIPSEPVPARAQFLRVARSAQGHHGRFAYAARLLIAHLGLGGMQQRELFFWARKPC